MIAPRSAPGIPSAVTPATASVGAPVIVSVDASHGAGTWQPVMNGFGYDEPNYTTGANGRKLLRELAELTAAPVYIRTHNLFTSGNGHARLKWGSTGVYSEDAHGRPVYHWAILDGIFDTYRRTGVVPEVELGFMPEALSTHPHPYAHHFPKGPLFTGWSYPPKSYRKWEDLVYAVAQHFRRRYGLAAVSRWRWEVWNEPDIGYWHGSAQEYFKLYDYSAAGLRRAIPGAVLGGPETTGPNSPRAQQFLKAFLAHCARGRNAATGGRGAPLDFISFHPKGAPSIDNGRQRMGIAAQLQAIDEGFKIVAASHRFHNLPVILGEDDPDGCAACTPASDPRVDYRNGSIYPAYNVTIIKAITALARRDHVRCETSVTWAFEFDGLPYFSGLRQLATNGIDLPVLNGFRMLGLLGPERLKFNSPGAVPLPALVQNGVPPGRDDIDGIATRDGREIDVLVWNYADERAGMPPRTVQVNFSGLPAAAVRLEQFRIDRHHSNPYTAWKRMGRPAHPNAAQLWRLRQASVLALLHSPGWRKTAQGKLRLRLSLDCPGLSLIRLRW